MIRTAAVAGVELDLLDPRAGRAQRQRRVAADRGDLRLDAYPGNVGNVGDAQAFGVAAPFKQASALGHGAATEIGDSRLAPTIASSMSAASSASRAKGP